MAQALPGGTLQCSRTRLHSTLTANLGGGLCCCAPFTEEEPETGAACPGHTAGEAGLESALPVSRRQTPNSSALPASFLRPALLTPTGPRPLWPKRVTSGPREARPMLHPTQVGENWAKGSVFPARVVVRGEGEWKFRGWTRAALKLEPQSAVVTVPEPCIPGTPGPGSAGSRSPGGLSTAAAVSAGPRPGLGVRKAVVSLAGAERKPSSLPSSGKGFSPLPPACHYPCPIPPGQNGRNNTGGGVLPRQI